MKRRLTGLLALVLVFCFAFGALCEVPVAESLRLSHERKYRLDAWSANGFCDVWLTTSYPEYMLEGDEDEPANFLHFSGPEGYAPLMFDSEQAAFLSYELYTLMQYYIYKSYSFEQFMEESAEEDIVLDGSDGKFAVIKNSGDRVAQALINVKEHFGRSAKLQIVLTDYSEDLKMAELVAMVTAEAERVIAEMQLEKLDGYWSAEAFDSVELYDTYERVTATLPLEGMTLVEAQDTSVSLFYSRDDVPVELCLSLTSYCLDESEERTLADGTPFLLYMNPEYEYGYAFFPLMESRYSGMFYLEVEGNEPEDVFLELLEDLWSEITIDLGTQD